MDHISNKIVREIIRMEKLSDKPITDFNHQDFVVLLNSLGCYSKQSFWNIQSSLRKYITNVDPLSPALQHLNSVEFEEVSSSFERIYFPNLEVLQSVLNASIHSIVDGFGYEAYDTTSAIVYLAWMGFSVNESVNLQKKQVLIDERMILTTGGKTVTIPDGMIGLFKRYKDAVEYQKVMRNACEGVSICFYKPSPYLLRTHTSEQLTPAIVANTLSKLSSMSKIEQKWHYQKILLSGKFCKGHLLDKHDLFPDVPEGLKDKKRKAELIKFYEQVFDVEFANYHDLSRFYSQYNVWKKCFYSE